MTTTTMARSQGLTIWWLLVTIYCATGCLAAENARELQEADCTKICGGGTDREQFGGDLLNPQELQRLVGDEHRKFLEQLKLDYGEESFKKIFLFDDENHHSGTKTWASPGGLSWSRMKRKLKIKILKTQIEVETQRNGRDKCSCPTNGDETGQRRLGQRNMQEQRQQFYSKYIWVNGGHSASAGHGNFYWETYTAVMERAMKKYFAAIGIEFIGRNYAMGGTSSGEEIALCVDQIFGTDIDSLSWDFGMTDAGHTWQWKQLLYTYHILLNPNRPATIGIDLNNDAHRIKIYKELEALGMIAFHENKTIVDKMKEGIPDTQGLTDAQIEEMPPLVKRFKCGEAIEKGDPGCEDSKYNMTDCTKRRGPASWHPGWKMHSFTGNSLALFMGQMLVDAVGELAAEPLTSLNDREALYKRYMDAEANDYAKARNSDIPETLKEMVKWTYQPEDDMFMEDVGMENLYLKPSFCHTAILPAEVRYKGLLTESDKIGFMTLNNEIHYDNGIQQPTQDETPVEVDQGKMRLAHDQQPDANCPYNYKVDFKDFFYLSSKEGWKTITVPNPSEIQHYKLDTSKFMGIIIICLTNCDWGNCAGGDLRNEYWKGPLKMEVNGFPVSNFSTPYSQNYGRCHALKNSYDGHHWESNKDGAYDIRARVDLEGREEPFTFLRFSSFILM